MSGTLLDTSLWIIMNPYFECFKRKGRKYNKNSTIVVSFLLFSFPCLYPDEICEWHCKKRGKNWSRVETGRGRSFRYSGIFPARKMMHGVFFSRLNRSGCIVEIQMHLWWPLENSFLLGKTNLSVVKQIAVLQCKSKRGELGPLCSTRYGNFIIAYW